MGGFCSGLLSYQAAAVLVWFDGNVIRPYPSGQFDDLLLVKPDQRTQYGYGNMLRGADQVFHGLGRHLSQPQPNSSSAGLVERSVAIQSSILLATLYSHPGLAGWTL